MDISRYWYFSCMTLNRQKYRAFHKELPKPADFNRVRIVPSTCSRKKTKQKNIGIYTYRETGNLHTRNFILTTKLRAKNILIAFVVEVSFLRIIQTSIAWTCTYVCTYVCMQRSSINIINVGLIYVSTVRTYATHAHVACYVYNEPFYSFKYDRKKWGCFEANKNLEQSLFRFRHQELVNLVNNWINRKEHTVL